MRRHNKLAWFLHRNSGVKKKDKNKETVNLAFEDIQPDKRKSGYSFVRIIGLIMLVLIGAIIIFLFQFPHYLNGPMGYIIPITLFILLFGAFYSLIISLKL